MKLEAKGGVYLASCNDIAETDQSSKVVNVPSAGISVCFSHLPSIPYFVFLLVRLFCESSRVFHLYSHWCMPSYFFSMHCKHLSPCRFLNSFVVVVEFNSLPAHLNP